jgi:hypothetical protein
MGVYVDVCCGAPLTSPAFVLSNPHHI